MPPAPTRRARVEEKSISCTLARQCRVRIAEIRFGERYLHRIILMYLNT